MRQFLVIFTVVFACAFGGAVAFNYAVDPYDTNIEPGRVGTVVKRETESHGRLHKAYALIHLHPSVIALGASRTEAGIRMDHAGWQGAPAERYNAAVTAANIRETWAFLKLAAASGELKQVVIGLEFYSFNAFAPNRPDFEPKLMNGIPAGPFGIDPVKARYYTSFDGVVSSVRTVASVSTVPHFLPDGTVNPVALKEAYHGKDGQLSSFLIADREALQLYYLPPPRHLYSFVDDSGFSTLNVFKEILDLARSKNIDLRLFISPAHARGSEVVHMLGLEDKYESWQRELVGMIEEEAAKSGKKPFPIWDFSAPTSITTEPVPPDNPDGPRSQWFYESSHYRRELGDRVLDRIFDTPDASRPLPTGFGVPLTGATLAAYQQATRIAREAYRNDHSAELALLTRRGPL